MPESLASKHCVPCRGGIPPLAEEEARLILPNAPGWRLEENGAGLGWRFEPGDFPKAMKLGDGVADIAEEEGHHPDIAVIHWNKVDLVLWTYKIGGVLPANLDLGAQGQPAAQGGPDLGHRLRAAPHPCPLPPGEGEGSSMVW